MVSRYSIVQHVPNPIADERINIGVLAFDDNRVCVRFLSNWERVKHFGMEDIHFLKDFASRMEDAAADGLLFPGDSPNETPKQERLIRVAQNWFNSIQLTEPRGSLDAVESLLADIADTCLLEPPEEPKPRDRAFAVQVTRRKIKHVLGDAAKDLVKSNYPLSGYRTKHKFDVVVANGQRKEENSKPLSLQERGLERGFLDSGEPNSLLSNWISSLLGKSRRRVTGKIPIAEFIS